MTRRFNELLLGFDAREIVFGLSIDHAEHSVGVGAPMNMRDAPIVADDRDVLGLLLPARRLGIPGGLKRDRRGRGNQHERELRRRKSLHGNDPHRL